MEQEIQVLTLDQINEPPQAMRTDIDRDAVFELAADIKKNGLINPITVRPVGERYEIVAGHRRFLAHRYGGMATIRAIVRALSDDEAFAVMTSENLVREDVNPVDEAVHTARLMEIHGGDVDKVCSILNRGRSWVEARIAIGVLPDDTKALLKDGRVSMGVALALGQITDDIDRAACTQMAISQGASVVMAQYWLAQWRAGLFGHATSVETPDGLDGAPGPRVIMLTCGIDGKKHPADEMTSVLVHKGNIGYIQAMREHLESEASVSGPTPGEGAPGA